MKVEATVKSKSQRIGEDDESFAAREPDRVVTIELDDVVTNPDDMNGGNAVYVGIRKPNARVTGAKRTVDAVLADTYGHVCTMDDDCMPECCAQWRFNKLCANTGGDCKFRKPANAKSEALT